jgi:kynureninase
MDELLAYRKEFPILARTTYMINHSLGAMPRKVYDRLHEYADMWATRGIRAWAEGWWEMPVTTGDKIAAWRGAWLGGHASKRLRLPIAYLSRAFDLRQRRNKIVYEALNFPSVMYAPCEKRRRTHREVASDDGVTIDTERYWPLSMRHCSCRSHTSFLRAALSKTPKP